MSFGFHRFAVILFLLFLPTFVSWPPRKVIFLAWQSGPQQQIQMGGPDSISIG